MTHDLSEMQARDAGWGNGLSVLRRNGGARIPSSGGKGLARGLAGRAAGIAFGRGGRLVDMLDVLGYKTRGQIHCLLGGGSVVHVFQEVVRERIGGNDDGLDCCDLVVRRALADKPGV